MQVKTMICTLENCSCRRSVLPHSAHLLNQQSDSSLLLYHHGLVEQTTPNSFPPNDFSPTAPLNPNNYNLSSIFVPRPGALGRLQIPKVSLDTPPVNATVSYYSVKTIAYTTSQYLPSQTPFNITNPLHDTNANGERPDWREQLNANAYGNLPNHPEPQSTAYGLNDSTHETPSYYLPPQYGTNGFTYEEPVYSLPPHESETLEEMVAKTSLFNSENTPRALHPSQHPTTDINSQGTDPQSLYARSCISDSSHLASNTYPSHGELSKTPAPLEAHPAPRLPQDKTKNRNNTSSGTSTSLHSPYKVSKSNDVKKAATRRRRRTPPNSEKNKRNVVHPSDSSNSPHAKSESNTSGAINSSTPFNSYNSVTSTTQHEASELPNVLSKVEGDDDALFNEFTTVEHHSLKPSDEIHISGFDPPSGYKIENNPDVTPTASESPQKKTQRGKKRERNVDDKPAKPCRPRKNPKKLHFCPEKDCIRRLGHDFRGFKTREDLRRHTLVHGKCNIECAICQRKFHRTDNLRK